MILIDQVPLELASDVDPKIERASTDVAVFRTVWHFWSNTIARIALGQIVCVMRHISHLLRWISLRKR